MWKNTSFVIILFFFILSRYPWIGDSFHDRLPFRSIDRSIDPRAGEYEGRDRATAGITRAGPEEVPSSRRSVFRQTSDPRSAGKSVFVDPKGETYLRERSRANLRDLENVIRARVPLAPVFDFLHTRSLQLAASQMQIELRTGWKNRMRTWWSIFRTREITNANVVGRTHAKFSLLLFSANVRGFCKWCCKLNLWFCRDRCLFSHSRIWILKSRTIQIINEIKLKITFIPIY